MKKKRTTEVDAYLFIKEDLKNIGWIAKNPLRTKNGQVFTQGECLDEPRIAEQLGNTKPENIVKISETKYYIIEAKAKRNQIDQALKEAEKDYADKINKSKYISAKIISGVAGNDIDGYVVKSKFLVNGKFRPIISNEKELTSLVSPQIAKYLLENNTNIIQELPIDEKLFFEAATKINVYLHNGAVPATERGKVISALLLSLVDETQPNVNASPTVLISEINARINAVLQREGKPEFYDYIKTVPPTTQANHKKFKNALVKTIQELNKLNIHSAMNSGTDVLGNFYEVFLKYGNWAKEIGIVLTPRHITKFAAQILEINNKDLIYDPTCGTGGFLVAVFDYAKKKYNQNKIKNFKLYNIFGVEQEPSVVALAIVNMIFRGDGKNNIKEANCFHEWLHLKRIGSINTAEYVSNNSKNRIPPITKVLMNPPFALKEKDEQEHKFVNQALAQMQKGGLLFAILPYSELIQDGLQLHWRRNELLANNTIECVVSFPEDLFYPSASKHTCGIVIRRGIPHDYKRNVLWIKITDDGYVKRKKKRIVKNEIYNDLVKSISPIKDFLHFNNVKQKSVPKLLKTAPIIDKNYDLELVPEIYLDNEKYSIEEIKKKVQMQLRGMLSFLVINGYLKYEELKISSTIRSKCNKKKINWINKRVDDLFEVESGFIASSFNLIEDRKIGYVPLFRPTSTIHNIVAGWVKKAKKNENKIFKFKSLMVSTDGEGSHTYSHITPVDFIPNSNAAVLKPKHEMPFSFLLFTSVAITNERWRFSYGRKPKGNRLKKLILEVPVKTKNIVDFYAFEDLFSSIPEYHIIREYYKEKKLHKILAGEI